LVPCLVIGDSIAVGVGQYLPECRTEARVGITSRVFVQALLSPQEAGRVVISLGVNDGPSAATLANLRVVRATVRSAAVYWLLPAHHEYARAAIRRVAAEFGDRLIDAGGQVGPDGLHPTGAGYRALARLVEMQGMVAARDGRVAER
jgi:lysophospholipase L1-like esterase